MRGGSFEREWRIGPLVSMENFRKYDRLKWIGDSGRTDDRFASVDHTDRPDSQLLLQPHERFVFAIYLSLTLHIRRCTAKQSTSKHSIQRATEFPRVMSCRAKFHPSFPGQNLSFDFSLSTQPLLSRLRLLDSFIQKRAKTPFPHPFLAFLQIRERISIQIRTRVAISRFNLSRGLHEALHRDGIITVVQMVYYNCVFYIPGCRQ